MNATTDAATVFQRLCESEISFSFRCVTGTGFDASLGSESDGIVASQSFKDVGTAVAWLANHAAFTYPKSEFAMWYAGRDSQPLLAAEMGVGSPFNGLRCGTANRELDKVGEFAVRQKPFAMEYESWCEAIGFALHSRQKIKFVWADMPVVIDPFAVIDAVHPMRLRQPAAVAPSLASTVPTRPADVASEGTPRIAEAC